MSYAQKKKTIKQVDLLIVLTSVVFTWVEGCNISALKKFLISDITDTFIITFFNPKAKWSIRVCNSHSFFFLHSKRKWILVQEKCWNGLKKEKNKVSPIQNSPMFFPPFRKDIFIKGWSKYLLDTCNLVKYTCYDWKKQTPVG